GSDKILYSGILLDYEVSPEDLLRLERVYLKDTQRYSKKSNETLRIDIPGDLFVLDTRQLLNININYPKSLIKENDVKKKDKIKKIGKNWYLSLGFILLLVFFIYVISLFTKTGWEFYDAHKWYGKTLLMLLIVQLISSFIPKKVTSEANGEEKFQFSWLNMFYSFLWWFFLAFLYW